MRKFILIPVVNLGIKPKGVFLEIISESANFGGVNFQDLKNSGLANEVAITEAILNRLSHPKISACHLYLSHHLQNLNSHSISLGLTLAVFLQQRNCQYHKVIAIGEIDIYSSDLSISGGHYFEIQIAAILALGKQPYLVALFIPAHLLNETADALVHRLAKLNFEVKAVITLGEALTSLGVS
ncbi:MAG: hypothetical protein L3J59_07900 [Methylococcaceae bacterium]|nr:hypothetical protein [Methylococcaceae bacterium]